MPDWATRRTEVGLIRRWEHQTREKTMHRIPTHDRVLWLIGIACLLVAVDQLSKAAVRGALAPGESIPLIDDVLRITFFQNFKGFSWWVPALPLWTKSVLRVLLLFILLAAFPVYLFYTQTRRQSIWVDMAVVGLSASACGHLLDDVLVGYTTDFIQVFHLPSANLADIYSYFGLGALLVETVLVLRAGKPRWKGIRHLMVALVQVRKEFFEFLREAIKSRK